MPNVDGKKFPYTMKGMKAAQVAMEKKEHKGPKGKPAPKKGK
jgi:hypothetical protein